MRPAKNVARFALSVLCGYLLAQNSLWPSLSELTPVALALLTIVALTAPPRTAVACGFAAGVAYWYSLLGWASAAGASSVSGLHFAAFTIAVLEALYLAGWVFVIVRIHSVPVPIAALTAGVLWSASEMTRTWGTWAMPYGEIGASQSASVSAASLQIVGTTGLTAAIVATVYALARSSVAVLSMGPKRLPSFAALALLLLAGSYPAAPPTNRSAATAAIAVVQARAYDSDTLRAVLNAARRRLAGQALEVIAFPEVAIDFPLAPDDVAWLNRFVRETRTPIIAGASVRVNGHKANAVLFFRGLGRPDVYVKQKLVPFGEFVPGKPLFAKLIHLPGGDLQRGFATPIWTAKTLDVSPLICFEIGFGALAFSGARAGADVLIVAMDDSWFSTPEGRSLQYAVARARARALGVDIIVAALRGPSAVFRPDGSSLYQGSPFDPFVVFPAERRRPTVYAAVGNAPLVIAGIALCCYYLAAFIVRRSRVATATRTARSS